MLRLLLRGQLILVILEVLAGLSLLLDQLLHLLRLDRLGLLHLVTPEGLLDQLVLVGRLLLRDLLLQDHLVIPVILAVLLDQ